MDEIECAASRAGSRYKFLNALPLKILNCVAQLARLRPLEMLLSTATSGSSLVPLPSVTGAADASRISALRAWLISLFLNALTSSWSFGGTGPSSLVAEGLIASSSRAVCLRMYAVDE